MPRFRLPRVRPGDPIAADDINSANEALERLQITAGAGIKVYESSQGYAIAADLPVGFWAKIGTGVIPTGLTAKAYAWTEQIPQAGGTWADGPRSGTSTDNPAYESTGNTGVASGVIVWLHFAPSSTQPYFTYAVCS